MANRIHGNKSRIRESAILIAAFGVPALILLPVIRLRTEIRGALTVSGISFSMAAWPGSAGLFNSTVPVDFTLQDFGRLNLDGPATLRGGPADPIAEIQPGSEHASLELYNVRYHSLDVAQEQRVRLDWEDKSLRIQIERSAAALAPAGAVVAAAPVRLGCSECRFGAGGGLVQSGNLELVFEGERQMRFEGRNGRLTFVPRPRSGQLNAERDIPIAAHSSIRLDRDNGVAVIVGDAGKLEFPEVGRTLIVAAGDSLVLEDLEGAELSIAPLDAGLKLRFHGSAIHIRAGSGALPSREQSASLVEYLNAQPWIRFYLGTVALIGTTLITVLNWFRIIKIKK